MNEARGWIESGDFSFSRERPGWRVTVTRNKDLSGRWDYFAYQVPYRTDWSNRQYKGWATSAEVAMSQAVAKMDADDAWVAAKILEGRTHLLTPEEREQRYRDEEAALEKQQRALEAIRAQDPLGWRLREVKEGLSFAGGCLLWLIVVPAIAVLVAAVILGWFGLDWGEDRTCVVVNRHEERCLDIGDPPP